MSGALLETEARKIMQEGRQATIRQAIQALRRNLDEEQIINQIKLMFGLSDEEALQYMK